MSGSSSKIIRRFATANGYPPHLYRRAKRHYTRLSAAEKRQFRLDCRFGAVEANRQSKIAAVS